MRDIEARRARVYLAGAENTWQPMMPNGPASLPRKTSTRRSGLPAGVNLRYTIGPMCHARARKIRSARCLERSRTRVSEVLAALCLRHHILRLSLFGSVLKGTDRSESDVDLLVEFTKGKEPGLFGPGWKSAGAFRTSRSPQGRSAYTAGLEPAFSPRHVAYRTIAILPPEDRARILRMIEAADAI